MSENCARGSLTLSSCPRRAPTSRPNRIFVRSFIPDPVPPMASDIGCADARRKGGHRSNDEGREPHDFAATPLEPPHASEAPHGPQGGPAVGPPVALSFAFRPYSEVRSTALQERGPILERNSL